VSQIDALLSGFFSFRLTQIVQMPIQMPSNRLTLWAGVAVIVALLLWVLGPVLVPFAVAAVLAYALHPAVLRLQKTVPWIPQVVCVLLVELLALVAVLGVLLLLVPILTREIPLLQQQLPAMLDRLADFLNGVLDKQGLKLTLDVATIKSQLLTYLSANRGDWMDSLVASLKMGGSFALAAVGNLILIPVVLFYLLKDWDRWVMNVVQWVPLHWRPAYDSFMNECDLVLGQYLRGQILVMLILSIFYAIGLSLFGLDLALPIGVFTGLAVCVPYIGFGIGLLLALLAGLLQFFSLKAFVMVALVFGAGQLLESFWLTPKLVGERIGLHPLAVIFALLALGQLFGFVGVLVALPASAVILVALRRLRNQYFDSKLYQGTDA
jgi:predicted PurR-regulated permease PerM